MNPAQILPGLRPAASILFIRLRSLGDILLSTPLYAALKAWRPDLQLSALVEEPYQELLLRNPDLNHLFSLPSSENPPYQGGKAPQVLGGVPLEDAVQLIEGHPPAPPSKGESNLQNHRQDQRALGRLLKEKSAQVSANLFLDYSPVRAFFNTGLVNGSDHSRSRHEKLLWQDSSFSPGGPNGCLEKDSIGRL